MITGKLFFLIKKKEVLLHSSHTFIHVDYLLIYIFKWYQAISCFRDVFSKIMLQSLTHGDLFNIHSHCGMVFHCMNIPQIAYFLFLEFRLFLVSLAYVFVFAIDYAAVDIPVHVSGAGSTCDNILPGVKMLGARLPNCGQYADITR